MAVTELKEAAALLVRMPVLWAAGIAGGAFAAITWLAFALSGSFFASRLLVVFSLALLFFTTAMIAAIRQNEATPGAFLAGGVQYYFRVLLPQLVIGFALLLVFVLCMITFALLGLGSDMGLLTALTFGIMVPTLMLTFFFDMAAVFEDRQVFAAIQRSILVVSEHMLDVLAYFFLSASLCAAVVFGLMIVWELALYEKLKPMMEFSEEQLAAFTPDQLMAMIGQDGIWVTAVVLFLGVLILLPLLVAFKACVYRKMASRAVSIEQQTGGEYDSKGRWYKY